MSNRKRTTCFILIVLAAGFSGARGATVAVSTAGGTDPVLSIKDTQPEPAAWTAWDDPTTHEPVIEIRHNTSTLNAINQSEPTPVAPVPTAFLSGASVLLGGAMLKAIRKLKRG